jgi:octaprenyl-diphosphate synthase
MSELATIRKPVSQEISEFNKRFSKSLKSKVPLLNIVTNYVLRRKGKQIRPLLVFLTAKAVGEVTSSTYVAASLVELLHTASLIHDDVVDNSNERRGFLSINALWKSKIAVLLGDYLLAKGLLISVENKEYELLEIVSNAVREMSEGELLQIQKSRKLNINEEEYFDIIRKKTATLLAACTASGAFSSTREKRVIEKMNDFGIKIGIAFQIKDDLFDYEKSSITGKPKGNDIQEKKLTLPLIASLSKVTPGKRKEILRLINKKSSNKLIYRRVYDFVHENGGLDYARNLMYKYRDEALEILNDFPAGDSLNALKLLVNFIVERKG